MLHSFRLLHDPSAAHADLDLLAQRDPHHPDLARYRRNPTRHAAQILYDLLKVAGKEEIERWRKEEGRRRTEEGGRQKDEGGGRKEEGGGMKEDVGGDSPSSPLTPSTPLTPLTPSSPSTPPPPSTPILKEQEYPHIPWKDLANPDVQMATIIYNDRINTYREMQDIEDRIDQKPTKTDIIALAELRIRNIMAFEELQALDDGKPLPCRHPLLRHRSQRAQLETLLKISPEEFLKRHRNTLDNIRRYRARLKDPKRKDRRKQDRELLEKHKEMDALFREIITAHQSPRQSPPPSTA